MNKKYTIIKDKPLPKSGRRYGHLLKLEAMDRGDSFEFPTVDKARVEQFVNAYGKRNGAAFTIVLEEATGTCWRVE